MKGKRTPLIVDRRRLVLLLTDTLAMLLACVCNPYAAGTDTARYMTRITAVVITIHGPPPPRRDGDFAILSSLLSTSLMLRPGFDLYVEP